MMEPGKLNVLSLNLLLGLSVSPLASAEVHSWFGGHARVNLDYRDWVLEDEIRIDFESVKLTGNLSWDSGNTFNFDVRYYDTLSKVILRYADFAWKLDEHSQLSFGVTRVPFGLQQYLSDSFWYSINYYVGLEDDYDIGFVYHLQEDEHSWKFGYFIADELNNGSEHARYSFDVSSVAGIDYEEDGQVNLYYEYAPIWLQNRKSRLGFSLQMGQIAAPDDSHHKHTAWSVFYRQPYGPWQTSVQLSHYNFDIEAQQLQLSAFDADFPVARKAKTLVLNQSYRISALPTFLDAALLYAELGIANSGIDAGDKSRQWVLGGSLMSGNFVFYLDIIHGENMWFSGGQGVALHFPDDIGQTRRVNLSLAYHF